MANGSDRKNRHFILEGVTQTEAYRSRQQVIARSAVPTRDRAEHGGALRGQLAALKREAMTVREVQQAAGLDEGLGLSVEFESFPDIELAFESLARERSGIELMNVRHEGDRTHATVFVPDGKLDHFEDLIRDYLAEKRDKAGRARDNRRLIDAIRQIRAAGLRALWTDDPKLFPALNEGPFWWEVWLPARGNRQGTSAAFRERAEAQEMRVAPGELVFPERTVLLTFASVAQMQRSMITLNSIAELRRAKETAEFFDALPPVEQSAWLEELLARTGFPAVDDDVPYVCLLDTGVNRGHPLITPAVSTTDLHSVDPAWGTDDAVGHGTTMAGLALAGNLTDLLVSSDPLEVGHRLESVKLLPHDGANGGDSKHHGYLTVESVARPEITAPFRRRVFGMAVTARDDRDRGQPSAWSSAVDGLAADAAGLGAQPRLMVLSAGNIQDPAAWAESPNSNDSDGVHDPGQAWNALTVGAYTNLVRITEGDASGYAAIAAAGGLSPFSTTSLTWQSHWPLKPDVVFEGGNVAKDSLGAVWMSSLSLLTAHHRPADRLFTTANGTSAASALATRMAAQVMAVYPELWPETIRALIVHSAEWTAEMRRSYLPVAPKKVDYQRLIRRCGFGVPDLERALWSVANSLTLVVQEHLHPFKREPNKQPTLRDMHLHSLPWPRDVLENLGAIQVEMRVTLSYFIEPNPSQRGPRSRYRYQSHALRFDVKRPLESIDAFRGRINAAAHDEEEGTTGTDDDPLWVIGKQARHKGSLHADIWRGTAADLASRGSIAVYPALGWWKTRPALERYDREIRYVLVVSIRAPEVDVDLYTEVANQVRVPIAVET